jgi:peptidylprolyl isomerase
VAGDFGAAPEVTFDAGITADTTERTTVIAGDGDEVTAGASAEVAYSIYNGASGELIESYGYADGEPVTFAADAAQLLPGLAKAIGCETAGSRVAAVIPAVDAWGEAGNEQVGVAAGESLVAVIDIESVVPTRADGVDQEVPEGLPTVTLAEDGTPTVAVPGGDAPSELQVAVLKKGDGDVVPASATVTVQYQGVKWSDGSVFDQSWGGAPASFSLDGVVPGFSQAIAGQTIGSQVIAVIPPALGYGEASAENTHELAGETLVFVIDILAIN